MTWNTTATRFAAFCLLAATAAGTARGQDGKPAPAPKEAAVAFLRRHVIGKSVRTSVTHRVPAEATETTFDRRASFANLTETANGFGFDEHYDVRQVIYDIDRDGRRAGPGRAVDRWGVTRYQVTVRRSVGALMGTSRVESTSSDDSLGSTKAVTVEVADGTLVVTTATIGVDDHFAGRGRVQPGFTEVRATFRVADGLLYRDQVERNYRVDPKTGTREPDGDPVVITDIPAK